ncbi:septal ring lytic transglycosylase RlpA family protein [Algiphilus sp.]|uniref:septal ring lytic transglycosylase RlpA family protein n=1 Tax=Algiphilus sp. TaxID=1872431 RepID=UPI003C310C14
MSARLSAAITAALLAAGCATTAPTPEDRYGTPAPAHEQDRAPSAGEIPPDVARTPDARVRDEPRSRYGNPDSYEVRGKRYYVLETAAGYRERGRASWYGKKFHGRRTSSGEAYDMFAMTAAHKTLPLPSFARVTNLENGRSAVVRVNDRGPFHDHRIIDLSYAAAARLGVIQHGSAEVEVEALVPDGTTPGAPGGAGPFVAAWSPTGDPVHAVERRERLLEMGLNDVSIHLLSDGPETRHEVRVGPLQDAAAAEAVRQWLLARDIPARHLDR